MILKAGAGLFAGMVAGGLGYAFWPHVEPGVLSARPAVEKPVFVATAESSRPPPATTGAVAAAPAGGDKNGLIKLAAAFHTDSAASPGQGHATRGIADLTLQSSGPSEEAARFCARGLVALADGDVAGARLFLERAADGGDSRALMVLGETYDPATLLRLGAIGLRGDAGRARDYYARALAAGVGAARQRIAALDAKAN